MEQHPEAKSGFGGGVAVGFALALVVSICAGGPLGYAVVKKRMTNQMRGWNLVPVVVAAVDIPAGTKVTFDMISQRSVPEQFVSPSIVTPSDAYKAVDQHAVIELHAGEPLRWSHFVSSNEPLARCLAGPPAK